MPQGRRADPGGYTAAICRFNEMGRAAKKFKRRTGLGQHGKSGVQLVKARIGKQAYLSFHIE